MGGALPVKDEHVDQEGGHDHDRCVLLQRGEEVGQAQDSTKKKEKTVLLYKSWAQ